MPLDGDWVQLRRTIDELQGTRGLERKITKVAGAAAGEQYTEDFAAQRDPWGKPWPATAKGKRPVLVGPDLELSNPRVTAASLSVRIRPVSYWVYHQMGAHGMAERQVLPFQDGSLWDRPIQAEIEAEIVGHFDTAD